MAPRETSNLEFKESVSRTFLKTVSAYANYGTGRIVFGIDDGGACVGLEDPVGSCLQIETMINDSIDPVPRYSLAVDDKGRTVALTVFEGLDKPYTCKGKAYKRNDSATIEVDRLEYGRLVLEGSNQTFDEIPAKQQSLEFAVLEQKMQEKLGIGALDADVLKTLELLTADGRYTNAAAILADKNGFGGVDIVRFGADENAIHDRKTLAGISALLQFDGAVEMFDTYYRYEKITGTQREEIETVPAEAFREALANAIVHRTWDIDAHVTVGMHPDRIEVASPGSLPAGLTQDEYLRGRVSVLRNPILANVFFRLGYIEKFGTGITRIKNAYKDSPRAPRFEVREASVMVILPLAEKTSNLDADEQMVLDAFASRRSLTRLEVETQTGLSKSRAIRTLNKLMDKGLIEKNGEGRGTRYAKRESF